MKSYTPKTYKKQSHLDDVLKTKGVRLERGKVGLGKIVKFNRGRIIKNNPQKSYQYDLPPEKNDFQSQCSGQQSLEKEHSKKVFPRLQTRTIEADDQQNQSNLQISQNEILLKKARNFVHRLKKQKEYEEGKAVVRRKKEYEKRQRKNKLQQKQKQKECQFFRSERYNQIMESILYHEERVTHRLKKSINRYRTSEKKVETEGVEDYLNKRVSRSTLLHSDMSNNSRHSKRLPVVQTLKKRVKMLSGMIDSLQS